MTYGEKAVGFSVNENLDVIACKKLFAELIDQMDMLRATTESGEVKRMTSIAITELQTACMWSVKSITWKD